MGITLKELLRALKGSDADARYSALLWLGVNGTVATSTALVLELARALADQAVHVRCAAAEAVEKLGPTAVAAVPALIKALEDQDEDVRLRAVSALGKLGEAARDAGPALVRALGSDPTSDVRFWAAVALRKSVGAEDPAALKPLIKPLIKALTDWDSSVRCAVARALAKIGPEAKRAIPALKKLLSDETFSVRREAAAAIAAIKGN